MIYLSLDKNKISLLALSKTILGQYHFSSFQKIYETSFLEKGEVKNVDLLASAIKEAFTLAKPSLVKEKNVYLILPQESFLFARYDIPPDISETAITPFINDKLRIDFSLEIDELFFDYLTISQNGEKKVLFFAQKKENFNKYQETLNLLGLSLKGVIPDTIAYFQLFKKTLVKGKKEIILYVFYDKKNPYGYLYDSFGLIKKERYYFEDNLEVSLKEKISQLEKNKIKVNRVILSGKESEKVRQDLFTKNIGAWTNPLKKIIINFYQEYLKLFINKTKDRLFFLDFDVCLGGFIFSRENKKFSLTGKQLNQIKNKPISLKSKSRLSSIKIISTNLIIFLIAFGLSFGLIFSVSKFYQGIENKKKNFQTTPIISPTIIIQTPTPTPIFKKETLKIKVLNGSGVKGKAAEVKEILKNKGYEEILTGNADNFDYEKTEIQIKDEFKEGVNYLKKDLSEYVNLEKISSLIKDSPADVIIIIGKDFK